MWKPVAFYLDTIDTKAADDAGGLVSGYSAPIAPLIVPGAVGGLITYLLAHYQPSWVPGSLVATMVVSFSSWAGFTIYYYRAVLRHRKELGLSDGPEQ